MKMLFFVFAVACSVPPHDTPPAQPHAHGGPFPHEAAAHQAAAHQAAAHQGAEVDLDPSTTCGRAQTCCRAFAAATPNVVAASACAETVAVARREDADDRCERMIVGWRVALEHHADAEPPDACTQ